MNLWDMTLADGQAHAVQCRRPLKKSGHREVNGYTRLMATPMKSSASPKPMPTAAAVFVALCYCTAVLSSCNKTESKAETEMPPKHSAASLPIPEFVAATEKVEQDAIAAESSALIAKRDFGALDDLGRKWRKENRTFANGATALRSFYSGLENISRDASDSDFESRIAVFKEWMAEKPESVTPRVALAEVLLDFAWKARGSGYADTVTEEAGRLMKERLAMAHTVLADARKLKETCPRWWPAAQSIALGEGPKLQDYKALCEEGLSLDPSNQTIYLYQSYHLQPRWYGKKGDWERFAAETAKIVGGDEGEMLYARIIWYLNGKGLFHNIFSDSEVKWSRVKRSFDALLTKYPESLSLMSEYAQLACNAADWRKARELFGRIGGRVDRSVWSDKENFQRFRADAFAHE